MNDWFGIHLTHQALLSSAQVLLKTMSPLSQSSCYRKLLTFAASALLTLSGISAKAEEPAAEKANHTDAPAPAKSEPATVDDKPSPTTEKPVGEAPASTPTTGDATAGHVTADQVTASDVNPSNTTAGNATPANQTPGSAQPPAPIAVEGTATDPTATAAPEKTPVWHKVQLRLSGSMCIACLKEMQGELSRIPGIFRAKVERPQTNYFQPVSPDIASWANGIILYDSERLPIEYLRGALKQLGYNSYHVVDRLLGREPNEADLKI